MDSDPLASAFDRPWGELEGLKERYWLERKQRYGPEDSLRLASELRDYVLATRPDWPSALEREEDLQVHVRVGELLRRVG